MSDDRDDREEEIDDAQRIVNNQDSEDEDECTVETVVRALEKAWLNEKFAPELLPHHSPLIDCMLQQIRHMEDNVKKLKADDIRLSIHNMELDRIRFVISSYLRCRLEKIERYAIHVLSEEAERSPDDRYMTEGETKFAKEYLVGVENLFGTVALRHMPSNFQEFRVQDLTVRPNLHARVFLRANKSTSGIVIPGSCDQEVSFEAGSQHIVQYKAVADLVKDGSVCLI